MHNDERDIINRIDQAIEHGFDAMRWTPDTPRDTETSSGAFGAILIRDRAEQVILSGDTDGEVRELVGDPNVDHFEPITGLDFWFGDESLFTSGPNLMATRLLRALINAVVSGEYAASDDDRDYARELSAPFVIHGPCLITGVDGTTPAPLPDAFYSWGEQAISYRREQVMERLTAALEAMGLTPRDHR